jgi:hypothetical protein
VSPVRDHHERQRVRGTGDLVQQPGFRLGRQHQLQQANHLAALGHRRQDRPVPPVCLHLLRLGAQRLLGGATIEGHHGGDLLTITPTWAAIERHMRQPHQRPPTQISDQERHTPGA